MKKISFIRQKYTPFGGAERYLERLINYLKDKNIECEIVHANLPKWLPSWIKAILFNYKVCKNKKNRFYFSLDRISCPDIYRAGDGVHKAFLKTKGFSLNPLHLTYLYLEKKTFNNAKKIIANSILIKEEIIKYYKIDPKKIEVIYNGIEIKDFDKEKAKKELQKEFKIDDEKIILFIGSGFKRKGAKEFLEIISQIDIDFKAFIVGKEKNISFYKNYAKELKIDKNVFFTGPRKDVDIFYAASDIFIFPTHYEPFSNVVLEAMSFENIVFTTKQNGASEILKKEYIMQNPKDFSIVSKIKTLLNDEENLNKIQKEMKNIAKNYTIEKNAQKTLEVINEFI
ncbi:glycosyltransferase family 4 protein [Nitrosophilus kaiyonis]|uniref:glycosyltransferase family 4 protein n=1 Tax=Nitrosophilus kaiyonis TaxID=2930200 RepID=UPI0024930F84|nr:glycosyltransferase family 4 protein [Nitrosophilus kaiyonis]